MFFRKKRKEIPACVFHWQAEGEHILFQMQQAAQPVIITEWATRADRQCFGGVAFLLGELENQADFALPLQHLLEHDAHTLRLNAPFISGLTNTQARLLTLPSPLPFTLDINHEGTLDQPNFRFDYHWLRNNQHPVLGAHRSGALLKVGSQQYRIPEPYYSLARGMDDFNDAPPEQLDLRFLVWGRLSALLPDDSVAAIQTQGYLHNTRVVQASTFTLNIQEQDGEFIFDPILLKQDKNPDHDAPSPLATLPSELFNQDLQETFARRFRDTQQAHSRYVLKEGWYVVVDDVLREALQVVHHFQHADHEHRRAFAKNPRAFLRHALGDKVNEQILEDLFVETLEYSQRVQDIGLWEAKVLPLVQKNSESWLPPEAMAAAPAGGAGGGNGEGGSEEALDGQARITLQIADNIKELNYVKTNWQPRDPAPELGLPLCLKSTLKPHQEEGLTWLQQHWRSGSSGGLLADDMGLGKTLQSLTFMVWLKEAMREGKAESLPILIVAPTGLLKNWEQEHEIHFNAPGLGAIQRAYADDLKQLRTTDGSELTQGLPLLDKEKLQAADWILTTYETLRDYQHSFGSLHFSAIIFDEVQKIKTPGTLMTEAAKAMHTEFILAMTGTPIENRLSDLWCIIDTVCPGYLGDLKLFSQYYEKHQDNMYELKAHLTRSLDSRTPPVMLRRMKEDHLTGFPELVMHILPEPNEPSMPPLQAEYYDEVIRQQADKEMKQGMMLEALQQLRTISLHPIAVEETWFGGEVENASLPAVLQPKSEDTDPQALDKAYIALSARLKTTFELLDKIQEQQEKVLIFLESQVMQRLLMALILRRYGVSPMLINGSVNGVKRQARVNAFQQKSGFDVFIISPLAGGVGLTLTAANHVIHLTRWWNPAVEDQCTCRAYRIGQTKTVHVYYPLAIHPDFLTHSFDWRLHNLLESKRTLSRDMLLPPAAGEQDMRQLYEETLAQ